MPQPDSIVNLLPGPVIPDRVSNLRSMVKNPMRIQFSDESKWDLKYGGIAIAAIGFVLTRLTVLPVIHLEVALVSFLIGDVLPLVVGLGITVIGIGLSISTLSRGYVNTIALWCVLGTVGMGLVAGVVVLQVALYTGMPPLRGVWASSLLANTLLAGALGGILIGTVSASNRQYRRDLEQQSSQSTILNRLLRHEVLNKLTVIKGYTTQLVEDPESSDVAALKRIHRSSTEVQEAVDDIGFLTRLRPESQASLTPVPIEGPLTDQVETIRDTYPAARLIVDTPPAASPRIRADTHLGAVFKHLLENAVQHNDAAQPRVHVAVDTNRTTVVIEITDNGPGLPEDQRAILETGVLPTYDDPSTGFGLPLVRMLVSQYGGTVSVETGADAETGTTITLRFPRVGASGDDRSTASGPVGVHPRHLGYVGLAGLLAGVGMGLVLGSLTDTLPAIGGLYGTQSAGVGWVLHLFHSVLFGLVFAAVLSRTRSFERDPPPGRYLTLGLGYGILLWASAAGIVMPVWLNLVGIPSPVPLLTLPSLVGHAVWGVLLGAVYGYFVG